MRTAPFRLRRAALLLGAAAALSIGCGALDSWRGRTAGGRPSSCPPAPEWLNEQPAGCALGLSGPTLHPADAIVYAQEEARDALAARTLGVRLRSVLAETSSGPREVTLQEVRGFLEKSRIVSIWHDRDGRGPERRPGVVYALACQDDADGVQDGRQGSRHVPDWLYNVPRIGGRLCALGLAGPTLDPGDRDELARTDALDRLADALAVRIDRVLIDIDREETAMASFQKVETWATEAAHTRGEIEEEWIDDKGIGPLGQPGGHYALACIGAGSFHGEEAPALDRSAVEYFREEAEKFGEAR